MRGDSPNSPLAVLGRFGVPIAPGAIVRDRLFGRLSGCPEGAVALLSAPGGWGKTLLVTSWLEGDPPPGPVAWVSLERSDNDEDTFWHDVSAALAVALGGHGRASARLRRLIGMPGARQRQLPARIADVLADAPHRVLLVLDNLHEVFSKSVHDELLRLVTHLSEHLQVIVCTRHDPPWPLHRLRMEGRLVEIRSSDLAFRVAEAGALLATIGVALTEDQLQMLVDRTEGWAGGLRLAGLKLAHSDDADDLLAQFSGTEYSVSDYLLSEVLEPAGHLHDFLVPVSIVDVVCGELADALTGRDDGAERLAELAAANVFMHTLGQPGSWYRLHQLIVDVLRAQLTDAAIRRDLHARAASWYLAQGQPWYALLHAVEAQSWPMAAELTGYHIAQLIFDGDVRRLDAVLSRIPHDVVLAQPELATTLAGARLVQGKGGGLEELLSAARDRRARLPLRRGARVGLVCDVIEVAYRRLVGDLTGVVDAARHLPDHVDGWAESGLPRWDSLAVVALSNRGTAELWLGDAVAAAVHLQAAVDQGIAANVLPPRLNAQAYLACLHYQRGELHAAARRAEEALAELTDAGFAISGQAVGAYLALAGTALDRDEIHDADGWLEALGTVVEVVPEPHVAMALSALKAQRDAALGRTGEAVRNLVSDIAARDGWTPPPALADRIAILQADLYRRDGNVEETRRQLDRLTRPTSAEALAARARLALVEPDDDPSRIVAALESWTVDGKTLRQTVHHELLLALLAASGGAGDRALRLLDNALLLAAPQLLRRPFLDQAPLVAPLLAQCLEQGTQAPEFAADLLHRATVGIPMQREARLGAPLTGREEIVLKYMISSLQNAEIAEALYVSVNTVKSHQAAIFRKLGVRGRREAVRRARSLGLL